MEMDHITLYVCNKKAETSPFKADQRQVEESVTETEKELPKRLEKKK